jgi:hypothetical protein
MLKRTGILATMAAVAIGFPSLTQGTSITLTDENSTVVIDPMSQAGASLWRIDGVDQLFQQWFWYRTGSNPEASIDTLNLDSAIASDSDLNGQNDHLVLNYSGNGFTIRVDYQLTGGAAGSHTADLTENIRIVNTGLKVLDFHFFQYVDFDLNNTKNDDTAKIVNGNTVEQSDPSGALSETVVTPPPDHFEIAFFSNTRDKLNDGSPTTLNDGTSPLGPGDVTWAFQWDRNIDVGGSFLISKDKQFRSTLVPETPSAALLLGIALTALGLLGRRYGTAD